MEEENERGKKGVSLTSLILTNVSCWIGRVKVNWARKALLALFSIVRGTTTSVTRPTVSIS